VNTYGTLDKELKGANQVWVCTWVGQNILKQDVLDKCKITKLILLDPEYPELRLYASQDDRKPPIYQNIIIELTRRALKKDIKTYWIKEPIVAMVIHNPEKGEKGGWARIGDFLPYGLPSDSPSYTVYESKYPDLFKRIVKSYSDIIDKNKDNLVTLDRIAEVENRANKQITNMTDKQTKEKTIIRDTAVKVDADEVDKATGIEINKPTEMSNVRLDMKLHDVKEGVGIKSGQPLNVIMATCKRCGNPLSHVSFGTPGTNIKCNQCGEINELR
jgi:hypothetical protein